MSWRLSQNFILSFYSFSNCLVRFQKASAWILICSQVPTFWRVIRYDKVHGDMLDWAEWISFWYVSVSLKSVASSLWSSFVYEHIEYNSFVLQQWLVLRIASKWFFVVRLLNDGASWRILRASVCCSAIKGNGFEGFEYLLESPFFFFVRVLNMILIVQNGPLALDSNL